MSVTAFPLTSIKAILSQRVDEMMANVETMSISDDDSDNELNSIGSKRMTKNTGSTYRSSFPGALIIDSIDQRRINKEREKLRAISKSIESERKLQQIVEQSKFLHILNSEEKELFVRVCNGPFTHASGIDLIKQGDIGDVLYLLEEGRVDVYVSSESDDDDEAHVRVAHSYSKPGEVFGHYALLYNLPRQATCRTSSSSVIVWQVDMQSVRLLLGVAAYRNRECFARFLKHIPILQPLGEQELGMLADVLRELRYEDKSIICKQHDDGDDFYIILDGEAECYRETEANKETLVNSLGMGQYFGEISLLTAQKRQATVRAKGYLKVLAIDRVTFNKVLQKCHESLLQGMKDYK